MNKKVFNASSKTHWATVGTGIAGGLLTFAPQVMSFIPIEYYGPIFIGLGIVFHTLRNITTTPIGDK